MIVAYYGEAGVPAMGVLASGSIAEVSTRLLRQAQAYARFGKTVVPAFELIVVAAQSAPGASDAYHGAPDLAAARRYLAAARAMHGVLILDVQPGRDRFMPLVKQLAPLLAQPDVGLALDPEWEMDSTQIPGQEIGETTATEVDGVGDYLAGIVRAHGLPQKLFVIHQFAENEIANRARLRTHPELATVLHVDGFGGRAIKLHQYRVIATTRPGFYDGFKLFYKQDVDMMTPGDVMRLDPQPSLVTYQ